MKEAVLAPVERCGGGELGEHRFHHRYEAITGKEKEAL